MSFVVAAAAAAAVAVPLLQNRHQHRSELGLTASLQRAEYELAQQQHREHLDQEGAMYKEAQSTTLALYAESMKVRIDLARRETFRDVWLQRVSLNQTMIIISALMITCGFENVSQGTIPKAGDGDSEALVPQWSLLLLAASLGSALLLSICSLWVCFKLQARLGGFCIGDSSVVYVCGSKHKHFNEYFDCHCENLRAWSVLLFYTGAVAVLMSAIALHSPKLVAVYQNDVFGATVFAAVTSCSVLFLAVGDGLWPSTTHKETSDFGGLSGAPEAAVAPY